MFGLFCFSFGMLLVFVFCFFKKSFILNGYDGKMEILEEKSQYGNSFSCLFKWKDGLSLK